MAELAPMPASTAADWPDLLAEALSADPGLSLGVWARAQGLHLGSVSRGFRQVFDLTPIAFRLVQRTRRAMAAVKDSAQPLAHVAHDCGFADQAHMTRAIRGLARTTPGRLRVSGLGSTNP
jgi:AraC-like DNA-binding protein